MSFEVEAWGFDTTVFALRSDDARWAAAIRAAASERTVRHHGLPALPSARLPLTVYASGNWNADCDYARLFGYPAHELVRVECRLAALLSENTANYALASPADLAAGGDAATRLALHVFGLPAIAVECRVQRADQATDIRFERPGDGITFVAACAHFELPRYRPKAHPSPDPHVFEGIEWKTPSNHTHARVYDKGLQRTKAKLRGGEAPGRLIRAERQTTFQKGAQVEPKKLARSNLRRQFLGAFGPIIASARDLAICGQVAAAQAVQAAYARGDLSHAAARRLQGDLLAVQLFGEQTAFGSREIRLRAKRELRKLGVIFDPSLLPLARVNVGEVFETAASKWPT